jgi:hypothetical protein
MCQFQMFITYSYGLKKIQNNLWEMCSLIRPCWSIVCQKPLWSITKNGLECKVVIIPNIRMQCCISHHHHNLQGHVNHWKKSLFQTSTKLKYWSLFAFHPIIILGDFNMDVMKQQKCWRQNMIVSQKKTIVL